MDDKNTIDKLQSLPYQTRVKILWATVAIVAVGLIFIMVQSIRSNIAGVEGNLIEINTPSTTPEGQNKFATVERVEKTENTLRIYFNFHNTTNDILNVSKLENITLLSDSDNLKPQKLTDRQSKPFVQKVLSQTQNFGILTFPLPKANEVTLTFDQLSFEKFPETIFKQSLELNLEELSKNSEVRN